MSLTTTNAQIFVIDGPLPSVNVANGANALFTPGNLVGFGLQSTTGVQSATFSFNCPKYPGLHQLTFDWKQGQANLFQVQMPANTEVNSASSLGGIQLQVVISDGSSSIANSFEFFVSKGANNLAFQLPADYVVTTALPAYTNTSGTLVGNANGAITSGMVDSATPAVGDTFFLPAGIAAAAGDVGLYTITAVGAAGAKFSAVPASGWAQGGIVLPKTEILIGPRGTLFGLSTWVITNTGLTNAIGSTSFTAFPRTVVLDVTLAAGTVTVTSVPIVAATKACVTYIRNNPAGTVTTTVMYGLSGLTAGALGTASITVQAQVAAGTIQNADTSGLVLTITNQV